MKLNELMENTVRVNQAFSDMTLGTQGISKDKSAKLFDSNMFANDKSEIEEPLGLIVKVITPIENDYRGMAADKIRDLYASSPELAFFIGEESGKIWMQDLLNEPTSYVRLNMNKQQFWNLLQPSIIN